MKNTNRNITTSEFQGMIDNLRYTAGQFFAANQRIDNSVHAKFEKTNSELFAEIRHATFGLEDLLIFIDPDIRVNPPVAGLPKYEILVNGKVSFDVFQSFENGLYHLRFDGCRFKEYSSVSPESVRNSYASANPQFVVTLRKLAV